jgi:hypothetical protein
MNLVKMVDVGIISLLVVIYMLVDSSGKPRKYKMMRHNRRRGGLSLKSIGEGGDI